VFRLGDESLDSSEEELEVAEAALRENNQRKKQEEQDRRDRIRLKQLEEVPPGLELFNQPDGSLGFRYFTFEDLCLVKDFDYARYVREEDTREDNFRLKSPIGYWREIEKHVSDDMKF